MKVVIVAHHAREAQAVALADRLGARIIMDRIGQGALWGHTEALRWASEQSERVVIMEDDAVPVAGFMGLATGWLDRFPDDLVSFYLGTGRPPQWQGLIAARINQADLAGQDHIALADLVHGVCYSVPPEGLPIELPVHGPADFAIGRAWRRATGRDVIYPVESLVDHEDGVSVETHPDGQARREARRAWRLMETA